MPSVKASYADGGKAILNGPISYPGTPDGYPFLGKPPDLRDDEYADIPLIANFKSRLFRLWDEKDHGEFDDVMDRIVNQTCYERRRIDRWSDEFGGLLVWLEWAEIFGVSPNLKGAQDGFSIQHSPGSGQNGNARASA